LAIDHRSAALSEAEGVAPDLLRKPRFKISSASTEQDIGLPVSPNMISAASVQLSLRIGSSIAKR
jgi:hypothetical protein